MKNRFDLAILQFIEILCSFPLLVYVANKNSIRNSSFGLELVNETFFFVFSVYHTLLHMHSAVIQRSTVAITRRVILLTLTLTIRIGELWYCEARISSHCQSSARNSTANM